MYSTFRNENKHTESLPTITENIENLEIDLLEEIKKNIDLEKMFYTRKSDYENKAIEKETSNSIQRNTNLTRNFRTSNSLTPAKRARWAANSILKARNAKKLIEKYIELLDLVISDTTQSATIMSNAVTKRQQKQKDLVIAKEKLAKAC